MNNFYKFAYFNKVANSIKAIKYVKRQRLLYKKAEGAPARILPGRPMPSPVSPNEPRFPRNILEKEEDTRPLPPPPPSMSGDPGYFGDREGENVISPVPYSYMDASEDNYPRYYTPQYMGNPNDRVIRSPMRDRYIASPPPSNSRNSNIILPPGYIPRPLPYNYDGRPLRPLPDASYPAPSNSNNVIMPGRVVREPYPNPGPKVRYPYPAEISPRPGAYND